MDLSVKESEEICHNRLFIKVERAQEAARQIEQTFHTQQCEVTENGRIHLFGINDTKAGNKRRLWARNKGLGFLFACLREP